MVNEAAIAFCIITKYKTILNRKEGFMAKVDFNQKELEVLKETLWSYLGDLRYEIADTDKKSWRDFLKGKEESIKSILTKLEKAK